MLGRGDRIPNLTLQDERGTALSLYALLGRPLVLFFYPKDETPSCTAEACAFRDAYEQFVQLGAAVVGVSSGDAVSHARFVRKHALPFRLMTDPGGAVRRALQIPKTLGVLPGRVTFVIAADGTILHAFTSQFRTTKHVAEALQALRATKGSMAEAFGRFDTWDAILIETASATPLLPGSRFAIASFDIPDDAAIRNLDDARTLLDEGLRPSQVVTRSREVTQQWALRIHATHRYVGVKWWSYYDPTWSSIALWETSHKEAARSAGVARNRRRNLPSGNGDRTTPRPPISRWRRGTLRQLTGGRTFGFDSHRESTQTSGARP